MPFAAAQSVVIVAAAAAAPVPDAAHGQLVDAPVKQGVTQLPMALV